VCLTTGRCRHLQMAPIKQIDLQEGSSVRAGTYRFDVGEDVVAGWHQHGFHEVEYAFEGVVEVETESARYLLPPHQAVWIPAGVAHCTTMTRVKTVAVFFDPDMAPAYSDRVRVLAAAPVIREMIVFGERWPISRPTSDPMADAFFEALCLLIPELLDHDIPLRLPTSSDPLIRSVMDYTSSHLDRVLVSDVCKEIGVSERSLRRAFTAATGMSWRNYLLSSRIVRAMAILAEPGPNVLETATQVGFGSVSAFNRAFRQCTGETPTSYRNRVLAG